jgi:hypothetical protein
VKYLKHRKTKEKNTERKTKKNESKQVTGLKVSMGI